MLYDIQIVTKDTAIETWNKYNPEDPLPKNHREGGKFDSWYKLDTWLRMVNKRTKAVVAISAYMLGDGFAVSGALKARDGVSAGRRFFEYRREHLDGVPQISGFRHGDPEKQEEYIESRSKHYKMNPADEEYPEIPDEIKQNFKDEYGEAWAIKKKLNWWNLLQMW
tara:strand:+ start:404 stop:901 length:498 start_codon:yes stop_codon:yes gene_type:complete